MKLPALVSAVLLTMAASLPARALPSHQWSRSFGDGDFQSSSSVATNGSGNVAITGWFQGTVDFGGDVLTSAGDHDIFVAKFDVDGSHLWSRRFGDSAYQNARSVMEDGFGNTIVTGEFAGTVDFGGGPLTSAGSVDVFVAKFDALGNHQWSRRFGDAGFQSGASIAVDSSGNLVLTGAFTGAVDFGGGPLVCAGLQDIFVAKLGPNGNYIWSRRYGDSSDQVGLSVATDPQGNIGLTGKFRGALNFGGGPLASAGGYDIFVVKFDPAGGHLWSRRFGDSAEPQSGISISADPSGNLVVTGEFAGTVNFGSGLLMSAGGSDIFVAKFDGNGNPVWSGAFGDNASQLGRSVTSDGSNNVILTGSMEGTVNFGGGDLMSAGAEDVFVAKFDPNGSHLWSRCFGESAGDFGRSVAVDPSDDILLTGDFTDGIDFGGGRLMGAGASDAFLAKFGETSVSAPNPGDFAPNPGDGVTAVGWLGQNFPNPFNPTTTIEYTLNGPSNVVLQIFDATGSLVVRLDEGARTQGTHRIEWNGRDAAGKPVANGVYSYRFDGAPRIASRRMVLVR